ncbi:MAG: bifunctional folylpolyglutamate synthase/dihydrofolate synthase [Dethiobacter sp.]|jgi:dihydrofolate synthase/folylpolyglutamate synthase|nr:bifunctional folylpolyglutamate synthase/dihydrofolate synthase [Dethiobacter sp.]MBS3901154.1 bifunctional folylpolyglutamate synthase/dihydrofolate synthase [Dethiobacter sp.]MBS3989154.1 bifunctional folylpolyglutamate synthase/dihydrofolate synthase [Dethiobacter sp.]
MDYPEALAWIHSLYRFGINPGLERVKALLERLGDPQKRLRCIHIAGTNGKGSTAAFLASMLEAEGKRVALYTSPYLEAFTNRMAINGVDIGRERLAALATEVRLQVEAIARTGAGQPTEFEVVTALAFMYFAEEQPDWVVVEVGLGGRLDATNVIEPVVCAITNIGLEHTQILGETIAEIAYEKAGIIKPGTAIVTAAENLQALSVIRRIAGERGAGLYEMDGEFRCTLGAATLDGQTFDYQSPWRELKGLQIAMLGQHQVRNAALALAARELLPEPFAEAAVRHGLAVACWPGRLEVFSRNPLVLADGAHNPDGIRALCQALPGILGGKKLLLVVGILADKAVDEILAEIVPLATAGLIVTKPDNPRAAEPMMVAEMARRYVLPGVSVAVAETVAAAVGKGLANLTADEALCVAGSLYTISEARETLKARFAG